MGACRSAEYMYKYLVGTVDRLLFPTTIRLLCGWEDVSQRIFSFDANYKQDRDTFCTEMNNNSTPYSNQWNTIPVRHHKLSEECQHCEILSRFRSLQMSKPKGKRIKNKEMITVKSTARKTRHDEVSKKTEARSHLNCDWVKNVVVPQI